MHTDAPIHREVAIPVTNAPLLFLSHFSTHKVTICLECKGLMHLVVSAVVTQTNTHTYVKPHTCLVHCSERQQGNEQTGLLTVMSDTRPRPCIKGSGKTKDDSCLSEAVGGRADSAVICMPRRRGFYCI